MDAAACHSGIIENVPEEIEINKYLTKTSYLGSYMYQYITACTVTVHFVLWIATVKKVISAPNSLGLRLPFSKS